MNWLVATAFNASTASNNTFEINYFGYNILDVTMVIITWETQCVNATWQLGLRLNKTRTDKITFESKMLGQKIF